MLKLRLRFHSGIQRFEGLTQSFSGFVRENSAVSLWFRMRRWNSTLRIEVTETSSQKENETLRE